MPQMRRTIPAVIRSLRERLILRLPNPIFCSAGFQPALPKGLQSQVLPRNLQCRLQSAPSAVQAKQKREVSANPEGEPAPNVASIAPTKKCKAGQRQAI